MGDVAGEKCDSQIVDHDSPNINYNYNKKPPSLFSNKSKKSFETFKNLSSPSASNAIRNNNKLKCRTKKSQLEENFENENVYNNYHDTKTTQAELKGDQLVKNLRKLNLISGHSNKVADTKVRDFEFLINNNCRQLNYSKMTLLSSRQHYKKFALMSELKRKKRDSFLNHNNNTIKMCQQHNFSIHQKSSSRAIVTPATYFILILSLCAIITKLSSVAATFDMFESAPLSSLERQQNKLSKNKFLFETTNLNESSSSDLLSQQSAFNPTRAPKGPSSLSSNLLTKESLLLPKTQSQLIAKKGQSLPSEDDYVDGSSVSASSSASSPKFIRTNELDVFLDDMNHNEVRSVASGQPINDLFRPKLIPTSSSTNNHNPHYYVHENPERPSNNLASVHNNHHRRHYHHQHHHHQAAAATTNDQQGLDGSASDRQIYSECALILQRTYVKNIQEPKHHLVPFGKTEQACISYKHIDKAIEQAKHNLKFREFHKLRKKQQLESGFNLASRPPPPPPLAPFEIIHSTLEPPEELIAVIGELNMATTQIIADQFDLSNDELLNGLPLIDMSKTKFWSICPLLVKQDIKCELTRFRTFTGHCNNLKHPTWGAAMTPFARYLPPVHPDGIWVPRKSIVTELTFDIPIPGAVVGGGGSSTPHNLGMPSHLNPRVFHKHNHIHEHYHDDNDYDGDDTRSRRSSSGSRSSSSPEAMSVAPSVQFIRHTRLDSPSSSVHHHHHQQQQEQLNKGNDNNPPERSSSHQKTTSEPQQYARIDESTPLASEATNYHPKHVSRKSKSIAQDLPSARLITSIVHRDVDLPSHDFSILFMSWGQMLDHDMTRAAQPPATIKCCNNQEEPKHKLCLPIQVPPKDPLYSKFNVQCLEFRRSLAGVRPNCVLGPRVHQNAITSPIDANFVYGSSRAQADSLRLFKAGRLRDRDWFHQEGLKPLLPAQEIEPDQDCIARPKDLFCFLAGDVRANEQTHLTVLHTLYMREHNRMADRLGEMNPHWDDERIYQETRHIMAAGVQNVMINEYIPLLIGKKMTELYNLTAATNPFELELNHHVKNHNKHYWHGYDPTVTTSVSNSFAAAAFRQGHTFVQGTVERYNKFHEFVSSERLRHLFKQPFLLYKPGVLDELVGGMINQPSQSYDPFVSEDISGHLFQPPEAQIGHDLPAINLQRGREQGLPGYNLFREWCGLPRAETFEQLEPYLTNHTAYHYSRLYKHVDDIDLWSGGVSERKLPGAAIGPTFACIIARQFSNTRRGDRFWFENPNLPSSFTPEQLAEIRKISLAKILCTNSDDMPTIQHWALRMPHPVLNPRVPCDQLPEIDLQYWQED